MNNENELLGTWDCVMSGQAAITFSRENFQWGKEEGRWKMQGTEIWFLDPNKNTGTKWRVQIERTGAKMTLILALPEDFQYRGRGQYFYFQMTPPSLTHRFERRTSL